MELENISRREKIRYNPRLCLRYSTTAAQVRTILQGIRRDLSQRDEIDQENLYVRFKGFGESGLDFKALIYVMTWDHRHYLEVTEAVNLRIMDIVAEAGAEMAEPLLVESETSQ